MNIKTGSETFIIPKESEGYVLFSYAGVGAFHISIIDGEVKVYIPNEVIQTKFGFHIQELK